MATLLSEQIRGHDGYASPSALTADLDLLSAPSRPPAAASWRSRRSARSARRLRCSASISPRSMSARTRNSIDQAIAQILAAAGVADGENFPTWPEEKRWNSSTRAAIQPPVPPRPRAHRRVCGPCARHLPRPCPPLERFRHRRARLAHRLDDTPALRSPRRLSPRPRGRPYVAFRRGRVLPAAVVPLFETMDDLHNSPGILGAFLDHPLTARSLEAPPVQQIMLGYSDSNKDLRHPRRPGSPSSAPNPP